MPAFRVLLVVLVLVASALPATAQDDDPPPRRITLDEAVRLALDANTALRQTQLQAEQQEVTAARERMDFFPALDLSSNTSRRYGRQFDQTEGRVVTQASNTFSAQVGANVTVFDGLSNMATYRQARLNAEAADEDVARARQTVVFDVITGFLNAIEAEEQIRIRQEDLVARRQQLARTEEFVEVGTRPESDLFQQQAEVAQAELLLLQARRSYRLAAVNLIQLLQLDPFDGYEFVAPSLEERDFAPEDYELDALVRAAFETRDDLDAAELDVLAAGQGVRAARAGWWPRVGLNGGYGSSYTSASFPGAPAVGFYEQFDRNRGGSVGFSISVPIFDRFQTRYNTQQAELQLRQARLARDRQQLAVAAEVRQAYLDYETAALALEVTQAQLRAAERSLEAEQARYDAGASTLVELSTARAAFVQAQSQRAQARYDFLFQQKLIAYYLGTLDPRQPMFD